MTDSRCVGREPCPECGSADNLARYDDGHAFCFSVGCGYFEGADGTKTKGAKSVAANLIPRDEIVFAPLPQRRLSADTMRQYDYGFVKQDGAYVHVWNIRNIDGTKIVGQRYRGPGKKFWSVGETSKGALFGSHVMRSKKRLVITEGEIDAMSVYEAFRVCTAVSITNGAPSAKRDVERNIRFLEQFEEIVLLFDTDEPGRLAATEVARALGDLPVKIGTLEGHKDANEALVAGDIQAITSAILNARRYRPDNVLAGDELEALVTAPPPVLEIAYPFEGLNRKTLGLRPSEMVGVLSGTGAGKSTMVREIIVKLREQGQTVGALMLEESTKRTMDGLVGLLLNKPIHVSREGIEPEELHAAFRKLTQAPGGLYLMDHFGSMSVDDLFSTIRYMVKGLGCQWIVLDHISIVVSGLHTTDERKAIDEIMTKLRGLVQETKCGLILVCHLSRPEGDKSHEEGARVKLRHARGSQSIVQLCDIVIAIERDQQDATKGRVSTVRVLKNRFTGELGEACEIEYLPETGRMVELGEFRDEDTQADF